MANVTFTVAGQAVKSLVDQGDGTHAERVDAVISARAATGTVTAVNSAATSTSLLAANTARKGCVIVNTDVNDLRIKFGATASATSFTYIISGNKGQWTMPWPIYTGAIDGIWDADGSGAAVITELS